MRRPKCGIQYISINNIIRFSEFSNLTLNVELSKVFEKTNKNILVKIKEPGEGGIPNIQKALLTIYEGKNDVFYAVGNVYSLEENKTYIIKLELENGKSNVKIRVTPFVTF